MRHSISHRTVALLTAILGCTSIALGNEPRAYKEVTIPPETKARLTIQTQVHSKLSESDYIITATLAEPIYVDGEMVLARGTEFHGRIVAVAPAKRGQRTSHISISFERVLTASGSYPISAQVTAVDDWDNEKTIKADEQGKMKGGRRGEKTIENMRKGGSLGLAVGFVGFALGGAAGASGRQVLGIGGVGAAAGMIGGVLLTKGNEIRISPGSILRIRFLQPATLQVVPSPVKTGLSQSIF